MGLKEELQSISSDELTETLGTLQLRLRGQETKDVVEGFRADFPSLAAFIDVVEERSVEDTEHMSDITGGAMLAMFVLREIAIKRAVQESL